jgi:hypothetical protein
MYPLNIFINSMFKSAFKGTLCLVLLIVLMTSPAYSTPLRVNPASVRVNPASVRVNPASLPDTLLPALPDSGPAETIAVRDSIPGYLDAPIYNRVLDRAIGYQKRADSLDRLAVEWRKEASGMDDPVSRGRLQGRIVQVEDSAGIYNMLANENFDYLSASLPEERKEITRHPFLVRDAVLNGITVYHYNLTDEFMDRLDAIREKPDAGGSGRAAAREPAGQGHAVKAGKLPSGETTGFRILDSSPYGPGQPFEQNYTIPQGVFYRIQLAVYSKAVDPGQFGGLTPITTESVPGKDLTRYFAGKFTRMDEAKAALTKIRAMGYPDAFIIGYYNGQKSSFSKLKALEE